MLMRNPLEQKRLNEWKQTNRRTLQSRPAQYRAVVKVTEGSKTQLIDATASSVNALRDINRLRMNAEIHARYIFINKGFSTIRPKFNLLPKDYNTASRNIKTEIVSEKLFYLTRSSDVEKRENINGKYFSVVRDKKSNRIISKVKWKNKSL